VALRCAKLCRAGSTCRAAPSFAHRSRGSAAPVANRSCSALGAPHARSTGTQVYELVYVFCWLELSVGASLLCYGALASFRAP
jgi:hypothetical protein